MSDADQAKPVIVLEFNELSPVLMDRFIAAGHLPTFARFRSEAVVCLTDAEEDAPNLEPWIQWVTVHTGKSFSEHGVFAHTEGAKYGGGRIWDFLSDEDRLVWICGSMNVAARGGRVKGMLLPDPWSQDVAPYPAREFEPYYRFVSTFVKEHTSTKVPLSPMDYVRFLAFMATHGLSPKTLLTIAGQLLAERRKDVRWARAFVLDRLQMDVFKYYWKRKRPAFSTYFINSTAHFQHFYWRNMEPGLFDFPPTPEDQATYADAILQGYKRMDALLGEVLEMAGEDTTIVFATGLSQQPMLHFEQDGGRLLHKLNDPTRLAAFAGVTARFKIEPAMSDQTFLAFDSEAAAADAAVRMNALKTSDGRRLLDANVVGAKLSMSGLVHCVVPKSTTIISPVSNETPLFYDLYFPIGVTSGYHHPDGMLWIRTPDKRHALVERKVSIRQVAPTLMQLCGVKAKPGVFDLPPIPELTA